MIKDEEPKLNESQQLVTPRKDHCGLVIAFAVGKQPVPDESFNEQGGTMLSPSETDILNYSEVSTPNGDKSSATGKSCQFHRHNLVTFLTEGSKED